MRQDPTHDNLAMARRAFADGRAGEAEQLLRRSGGMDACLTALREYLVAEGRIDEALAVCRDRNSGIDRALLCHARGDFPSAEAACREALETDPEHSPALLHLARAVHNQGRAAEAISALDRAVTIDPDYAEAWYALAHARRASGDMPGAVAAYERALSLSPGLGQARFNLGLTLLNLDDPEGALECFERLLSANGRDVDALIHAGLALQLAGRLPDARARLEAALRVAPGHPEAHRFLAAIASESGDAPAARDHLQHAINADPRDPDLYAELAGVHELSGQLEAMREMLDRGLSIDPDHPRLLLESARLDRRQGDCRAAVERLRRLAPETLPPRLAQQHFHELGLALDRLDRADEAMAALETAHRIAARNPRARAVDRRAYFHDLEAIDRWLAAQPDHPDTTTSTVGSDLCFMIGFPRSGTTLIDTALDTHPDVAAVEERPTLEAVIARLDRMPGGYPKAIDRLDEAELETLRSVYRSALEREIDGDGPGMIVDKLPLRLVHAILIRRLFPAARLLFVRRHPCDVVLSNFMQLYEPNQALIHCDSLAGTVKLYDAVLSLWHKLRPRVADRLHVVCYEALVEDPRAELTEACRFLGLDWRDEMLDTERRSRTRERIRTTSYQQVGETIYRRASGRWQRYRTFLEPHLETLDRHARELGYDPC
ncbi:MAG: tetratricopeptide repeat protein [Gammaproteobacteria bacterium]|jgi:tetratricopeptide (TPR) repeat protein|nr:tetratricopeptide repeat protein [Gammaproteobacteria bacterium]